MLILIDQDNVLADFEQGMRRCFAKQFPKLLIDKPRRHFYWAMDYPEYMNELAQVYTAEGFFVNLPPMTGAIEALHELLAVGHDVRICTSPITEYRHCVTEKFMWVERHLGKEWVNRIILTKDKTWVRGDILIDDKPGITGSLTPVWQHWVYDQTYNRHLTDKPRVSWQNQESWQHLLANDV